MLRNITSNALNLKKNSVVMKMFGTKDFRNMIKIMVKKIISFFHELPVCIYLRFEKTFELC